MKYKIAAQVRFRAFILVLKAKSGRINFCSSFLPLAVIHCELEGGGFNRIVLVVQIINFLGEILDLFVQHKSVVLTSSR